MLLLCIVYILYSLIVIVIIQQSKDDIGNTLSGEKSELFKNQKQRGPELFLARATWILAILFIILSVLAMALK